MTPGRNRVRTNIDSYHTITHSEGMLPDAPENPEFLEYPQAFQDLVSARIDAGVSNTKLNDILQLHATQQAARDCAQRFRDAAAKRANTATIGDAIKTDAKRRREHRNGGV